MGSRASSHPSPSPAWRQAPRSPPGANRSPGAWRASPSGREYVPPASGGSPSWSILSLAFGPSGGHTDHLPQGSDPEYYPFAPDTGPVGPAMILVGKFVDVL